MEEKKRKESTEKEKSKKLNKGGYNRYWRLMEEQNWVGEGMKRGVGRESRGETWRWGNNL